MTSESFYGYDCQSLAFDPETHLTATEGHPVFFSGIVLIPWPRVDGQHLPQSIKIDTGVPGTFREYNLKGFPRSSIHKTGPDTGVRVGVFDIGFDIIDRCPVHKVRSQDIYNRSDRLPFRAFGVIINRFYTYGRQPKRIRPEGRPAGEHSHTLVPAQPRRPNSRLEI